MSHLTLQKFCVLDFDMLFESVDLVEVLFTFLHVLIFAMREGDDFEMVVFVLVKQYAELFHELEALFAEICMLFVNHELLNWLDSHVSVKDCTNQKVKNQHNKDEAFKEPKERYELGVGEPRKW